MFEFVERNKKPDVIGDIGFRSLEIRALPRITIACQNAIAKSDGYRLDNRVVHVNGGRSVEYS